MIKDPNCNNKVYRIDDLDNIVFNEIKKLAIDPDYLQSIKQEHARSDIGQQIHAIENKINSINQQISRFMDLYGIGKFTMAELDEKTTPLQDQRSKLKKELESLTNESKKMPDEQIIKLATSFEDAIEHGTLEERRSIIEALINKIMIDGDDITIHWNFA